MTLAFPSPPLTLVTGLALTLQPDGGWVADYCTVRRRRDTVTVVQQGQGYTSVAALREALGPEPVALALALAGRGVLLRTSPTPTEPLATAESVAVLLPGVNPAEFYVQAAPGGDSTHLALVRRTVVDQLLADLQAADHWVVDLSLGPGSVTTLLPYLSAAVRAQPLRVGDFDVRITGENITALDYQPGVPVLPGEYAVGAESLSASQLLPYAAALTALLHPWVGVGGRLALPKVTELRAEWGQRQRFLMLRLAVPLVILLLLLANFLAGQHLVAERDELAARLGDNQQLLHQVQTLQREVAQKHAFLTTTGWEQPSWNSLCADRLAASLPPGLDLLVVDVSPAQPAAGGGGHAALFRSGTVSVKGQCRDAQRLNQWLQELTRQPWVQAVQDQNFAYDYAGGLGTFTFTLVLRPAALLA
jgi:Tfp pilus assembly protein PilN